MAKAPIYKQKESVVDKELLDQLNAAFVNLEASMVPSVPIKNGLLEIGFGVSKAQRSIAVDTVIAIARQIKGRPGW